jgi:hypothetical protein
VHVKWRRMIDMREDDSERLEVRRDHEGMMEG